MKLSETQIKLLNFAKHQIDRARFYETFEEYQGETDPYAKARGGASYVIENYKYYEAYKHYWEDEKNGIVVVSANSSTLKSLEKAGLIEIIDLGGKYIDTIKILNY